MVRGIWIEGRLCPHFVCDWCDKPITDAEECHVVFDDKKKDDQGRIEFAHVHKGQCDRAYEQVHGGQYGHLSWTPLSWHLVYLVTNAGSTPKRVEKTHRQLLESGF